MYAKLFFSLMRSFLRSRERVPRTSRLVRLVLSALSTLTRTAMTHNQYRSLISAAAATAATTEWHVRQGALLAADHGPLDEEPLL